jgi:hypothetical protein
MNSKIIIRRPRCGFFSDFLTAIAGIMYCNDNSSCAYIDWQSDMYEGDKENLFDSYFKNSISEDVDFDKEYFEVTPYGYYFIDAANLRTESDIYRLHLKPSIYMDELNILDNEFIKNIDIKKKFDVNGKILGVHKRGSDIYRHGVILSNKDVLDYINEEFRNSSYDKIFLSTDDNNSLDFFKKELGDSLIYTDSLRVSGDIGVHFSGFDKKEVASNIVTDAVMLSQCDFKLLTKSNVSTFANIATLDLYNFRYTDLEVVYTY